MYQMTTQICKSCNTEKMIKFFHIKNKRILKTCKRCLNRATYYNRLRSLRRKIAILHKAMTEELSTVIYANEELSVLENKPREENKVLDLLQSITSENPQGIFCK